MTTYTLTAEQREQLMTDADAAACYRLLQSLQPNTQEPRRYEYRGTNPAGDYKPDSAMDWKLVEANWNGTVLEKCKELASYRYGGKPCYEVRVLYDHPYPQKPAEPLELSGDEILECEQLAVSCASSRNDLTIRTGRAILAAANAKRGVKP